MMKKNKKNIQIMTLLFFSIIILIGVVVWGFFQHIRYDEYVVKASGYTLNEEQETIQFPKESLLYRTWDEQEIVESSKSESVEIAAKGIIHLETEDILFQNAATIIDTSGVANKIKPRSLFKEEGSAYVKANQKIANQDIVKIANRNYFFNASAEVFVDGEKVDEVTRPQLLVDKTGSVTIYSDQKKKRYIGSLELKVSNDIVFEVSNEKYVIGDRVIDLSKFDGSDNEKYVVDAKKDKDDEEKEKEEGQETKQSNSQEASEKKLAELEKKYDNTSLNDKSGSTSGSGNNQTSEKGNGSNKEGSSETDIPSIEDYDQLMRLLEKLNDDSKKQIPSVNLSKIKPTVNSVTSVFRVDDLSGTLVGPIEVQVWDAKTDKVFATYYMTKEQSYLEIVNLAPNSTYYLGYKYQYDLGDGKGLKEIKVKDRDRAFTTLSVSAIYNVTKITSNSIEASVYLDSEVDRLMKAELSVVDIKTNTTINTVNVETKGLNTTGSKVILKNLETDKEYRLQLGIVYDKSTSLTLNGSNIYKTGKKPELYKSCFNVSESGQFEASYQWNPGDYLAESAKFYLKDDEGELYETIVTEQKENVVQFVPKENIVKETEELSVVLEILAHDQEDRKKETFSYELDGKVPYKDEQEKIVFASKEQGYNLFAKVPTMKNQVYHIEAQRKLKDIDEKWSVFEQVELKGTGELLEQAFHLESAIEKKKFDYRIAVMDEQNKLLQYIY
ncbi:hypothetical protein KQY60_000911 [Listeria monocytogenes]|uniref:hypothetical protein n=1 Tax=Listeria monocytogenes TaxID=1639 RepID=UPI0010CE852E|nr:hypothetical protein [Listeria monocytogenes]EAE3710523.1 hypothetical protein [Listeria monocytogenes serotype 1/2b]EAE5843552.1 hypothetical protein [Listeria monocytogenes]EAF2743547.1 hypothetical protein [Listeria monocytogenes]EAF3698069.1 hypothetical protein [Listeria monocytogenes]EAF3718729.1 hypothetical protein [Listeria monocytogenes]